jgi:hypothetical protein
MSDINPFIPPTIKIYNIERYTFGVKEPKLEKDTSVKARLKSTLPLLFHCYTLKNEIEQLINGAPYKSEFNCIIVQFNLLFILSSPLSCTTHTQE